MNVLICFASKGKTAEEIEDLRASVSKKATRAFKQSDHEEIKILDPFILECAPRDGEKDSVLFISGVVAMLSQADAVYFAKNWSTERYCKVTFQVAQQYGIKYHSE